MDGQFSETKLAITLLRVLHVTPSMHQKFGGIVPAVMQLVIADRNAGRPSCIVAVGERDPALESDLALVRFFLFRPGVILGRFSGSVRQVAWIIRSVKDFDVIIVHSFFHVGALVANVMARYYGKALVIRPHGSLDVYDVMKHAWAKRALAPLWFHLLKGDTQIWCTAEREGENLETFGASPEIRVLPLAVNRAETSALTPLSTSLPVPAEHRIVLFLGRIDPKKGLERLLAAWIQLPCMQTTLVIAGSGEVAYEARVRRLVIEARAPNPVLLFGWANAVERSELLRRASVFVLPSDNENFGIAAVEALMEGCPVILSDGVYIAADLWRANGALRCGRDVDSLRDAMGTALSDTAALAEVAARGRAYVEATYSHLSMASHYADLLRDLECATPR